MPSPSSLDIRSSDIAVFLKVRQVGTMGAAARALETTTAQVSKAIGRLERALKTRLLVRNTHGVQLTSSGQALAPYFISAAEALINAQRGVTSGRQLSLAGPSFLLDALLGPFATALPSVRWRTAQLSMSAIRASAARRQFELALLLGQQSLPPQWISEEVGVVSSGLFAAPRLAKRLKHASVDALLHIPFVTPIKWVDGQWEPFEDNCPLPVAKRRAGHEVASIALALTLATHSEQLVFGPHIAARPYLAKGQLVEVKTPWSVEAPLMLAFDSERITANELRALRKAAQSLMQTSLSC